MSLINSYRFAGPWTPASLPSLAGWWDAADASTFTFSSGVVVSQWRDKSGNNRHFAQGTVTNQPSRSGAQNGLTTVLFDGIDNYLDTSSFTLAQPLTILFAGDRSNVGAASTISSVGNDLQVAYTAGDNGKIFAGTAEVEAFATGMSGVHCVVGVVDGASSNLWRDGTAGTGGNPGAAGTTTGLRIAERGLANYFNGEMFEIAACSVNVGSTDRAEWLSYCQTKWATP